ncbi:MAG: D-2-hydroxyacid dehydrogenase [Pseudomonadota bacterium]
MNAVFLDVGTLGPEPLDLGQLRRLLPNLECFDSTPNEQLAERVANAEYVLTNKAKLDATVLGAARRLTFIGLVATGTDNVALDAARSQDIAVCNIRAYCTRSVVEHVFSALLMLTRSTPRYVNDVRAGRWQQADNFCLLDHPIRELSALKLGVVGYGVLGRAVAETAKHFGMQVAVAARRGTPFHGADERVEFMEVLQTSDVVSLHCPLNEETRHLIGRAELDAMRDTSILINTARGALVDTEALAQALECGSIGGAAIDVLAEEPPVNGDPLLRYSGSNLILTPHVAWGSREARQNAIDELTANVAAFQAGERRNRVD